VRLIRVRLVLVNRVNPINDTFIVGIGYIEDACQSTNIVTVLPTSRGSDWVYHTLGNAPVLRSGTGSWVLRGQSGACPPLSPVIRLGLRNQERKKERYREFHDNP